MNRNQLCSCGSGRRYKHCHGAVGETPEAVAPASAATVALRPDPLATLHLALARQKEGRLVAAEALYEQALEGLPGNFDALHMLGVVKLQLGKFEEGVRLLLAGLPLAPDNVFAHFKHNLALCLAGLARQRGMLEVLLAGPPALERPAPFARARVIPRPGVAAPFVGRISVVLSDPGAVPGLARSLASVGAQDGGVEIVAALAPDSPGCAAAQAALDGCGLPARLTLAEAAGTPAGQANVAAAAGTGTYLCFVRAGDRHAPGWLRQMIAALEGYGLQWGFGGLRAVAEDGTIVRFGSFPDVDALLRAQDALYLQRTASLGFLSFNPIAAGRNLVVTRELWSSSGGLVEGKADPFLDWAWRTAADDEPIYVDEPGYLIPPATAGLHLHDGFARMIAGAMTTGACAGSGPARADFRNRWLRHGLELYWSHQWRQIVALRASTMPMEALQGCAAMLGMASVPAEVPVGTARAA